jgi:hypothetical protein
MWWRFSATTFNNEGAPSRVQAVELCMNKWSRDMGRYEWGMQWANVSDGSPEAGVVPTWRLWTGTGWKNVGPTQRLTPDTWHYFLLQGDIVQGQVRYVRFVSDSAAQTLGHRFAPQRVAGGGEPVVAFQIDGNFRQEPYDCFFDAVSLQGFPTSPWSGG